MTKLIDTTLLEVRTHTTAPPKIRTLNVSELVSDVCISAKGQARIRGVRLVVHPPLMLFALGDYDLMLSAVSNLVQNAIKFTAENSTVRIRAHSEESSVVIEVEDECGGLTPEMKDGMFGAYQQYAANRSGVGLGLTISRRAIERCGGTLDVMNLPAMGCVMIVKLPIAPHA